MSALGLRLDGTQLIEASAGTGKTHAITTLFLRLLLEKRLGVGQILVVTYTNAATAELRERIRSRLAAAALACGRPGSLREDDDLRALLERRIAAAAEDRAALDAALHGFDEAAVSTIHGFCQRVLREQAFETRTPFAAELLSDARALRDEILHDLWVRALAGADTAFLAHLEAAGVRPSTLAALVGKALGDPDLRILPQDAAAADTGALAAWGEARDAAREEWRRDERQIRRSLADPAVLNQTTYRVDRVEAWLAEVEQALGATPPLSARSPWLERLTPAALARGTKRRRPPPDRPFFALCERLWRLDGAVAADFDRRLLALKRALCIEARREAAERKQRRNLLSFQDLLVGVRDALRAAGGEELAGRICRRHPAALIDEFQDTDPIQYEIFDRVWRRTGAPLVLVGDPKQAIYAFRGADVHTYLRAKDDAAERTALTVNYRSDPGLLEALNRFFAEAADPFATRGIDYVPLRAAPGRTDVLDRASELDAPLRILLLAGDELRGAQGRIVREKVDPLLPGAVAAEIVRLLEAAPRIPRPGDEPSAAGAGDVAVLCRTNAEARDVQAALQRLGVAAVLHGDRSVFESEEARELRALLRAMADPADPRLVRAALATSLIGVSATGLAAAAEDDERWDETVAWFTELRDRWTGSGFMRAFRRFLDTDFAGRGRAAVRLRALPGGERRLTNLLHLGELLHEAAVGGHRGPYELIDWLGREIEEVERYGGGLAPEERQIRLESDARAVTLTTIHQAKGLEWPFVFCPYLWERSFLRQEERRHVAFHDAEGRRALDLGSPARDAATARALEERRAEDLRLLYVALTRARHQCSIVWGGFHDAESSPLGRFLAPEGVDLGDDQAITRHLSQLCTRSAGTIALRRLSLDPSPPLRAEAAAGGGLAPRAFARGRLDESWRTASFTTLAAGEARLGAARSEGRDRDEIASEPGVGGAAGAAPRLPLAEFPAGARAGTLVHEIFERIDLARADPDELGRVVESRLRAFGFDPRWNAPLERTIAGVLEARLEVGGLAVRLADVAAERRAHEMEFTLPLGSPRDRGRLTPAALAAVFARHPSPALPRDYPARLRALGFAAVAGFLRGYVDLAFEHAGRFFLVDWKSNHLGPAGRDYRPAALAQAMAADHYVLQYHLYLAALHRHLAARVAGYGYETHVGGVFYVFVRGVTGGGGIFADRPPAARIEALSRLLAEPAGEAAA